MKAKYWKQFLPMLMLSAFLFQSCGNIDIVKRRYRPGFHVDVSKKKDRKSEGSIVAESGVSLEKVDVKKAVITAKEIHSDNIQLNSTELETLEVSAEPKPSSKAKITFENTVIAPFREARKAKLDGSLRRAVFNKEKEEKYGWSGISFASMGLGTVALALMITGIVLLVLLIAGGSFLYWWIFTLIGFFLGIAGMVTGIIGLRQTGAGEKRGRGFALAGMLGGIVAMAGGLITAFWGLIYYVINGRNEDF